MARNPPIPPQVSLPFVLVGAEVAGARMGVTDASGVGVGTKGSRSASGVVARPRRRWARSTSGSFVAPIPGQTRPGGEPAGLRRCAIVTRTWPLGVITVGMVGG